MVPRAFDVGDGILAVNEQGDKSYVAGAESCLEAIEGSVTASACDEPWHAALKAAPVKNRAKRLTTSSLLFPCVPATFDVDRLPTYQRTPPRSPRVHS
jgi:hypothetical protein